MTIASRAIIASTATATAFTFFARVAVFAYRATAAARTFRLRGSPELDEGLHDVGLAQFVVRIRPVHQPLHALPQPVQHTVQRITGSRILARQATKPVAARVQRLQEAPNLFRYLVRVLVRQALHRALQLGVVGARDVELGRRRRLHQRPGAAALAHAREQQRRERQRRLA
jgi:hypothetical protein